MPLYYNLQILGRRQGVRHGSLESASAGSNPAAPAIFLQITAAKSSPPHLLATTLLKQHLSSEIISQKSRNTGLDHE